MLFDEMKKYSECARTWVEEKIQKNRETRQDKLRKEEFLSELLLARRDLETARNNYNFAKDSALLEYYIYEIKAAETRLNYYLKLAKQSGFSNEGYLSGLFSPSLKRREEIG